MRSNQNLRVFWKLVNLQDLRMGEIIAESSWRPHCRKSSFCFTDGHLSPEKCCIGGETPKIQRSNCTPRWYCKNDCCFYAVITEQGSSASQMTRTEVIDIISRLPRCAGQAADAVPAYTQVKMEDAHKLFRIPKSECPDIGFVYHDTNGQNLGPVWKTQSFLLNEIRTVIL